MRAVVQRVVESKVEVEQQIIGQIGPGLLVFLGVEQGDGPQDLNYIVNKLTGLRVFEDAEGLMNKSVLEVGGEVLVVSQFTLLGDVRKGKRPSFTNAAVPSIARELYQAVCEMLGAFGLNVQTGEFQADMKVMLVNDGPVTILIDSRKLF